MKAKNEKRLSSRFELVLRELINEHIHTGQPVGSRTISKRLGNALSPATVRNVMQDLEEMGFVRQPHTSAGRVPTANALRYYIKFLMKPKRLSTRERQKIEKIFLGEFSDILQLLEGVGKILASISDELGLIVSPSGEELILHRIELIPITSDRLVMVLVTKSGLTRSLMMDIPSMPRNKLDMIKEGLNQRLSGLKFSEIRKTISERLADLEVLYGSFTTKIIQSAEEIFKMEDEIAALFGRENIVNKPEFSNPDELQEILELFEEDEQLIRCLPHPVDKGVEVFIGPPAAEQLGMVIANYPIGSSKGILGVVGPIRMDYSKLIELVSFTARKMTELWKPQEE
ncbi:heat-inducible transcription repressor HrcA [bacterium]|nr:heat-inducible transcription repressor HrcA [bacterium]